MFRAEYGTMALRLTLRMPPFPADACTAVPGLVRANVRVSIRALRWHADPVPVRAAILDERHLP
jgi:hypothetical protein